MVVSTPDLSQNQDAQILVVEDEFEICELISMLLKRQGFSVKTCTSVHQALDCLKKNKYDLMVLDWMLPEFSGIDLLKSLQTFSDRPPVLMVTAKAEPQDIVFGLEAGADDYITKPFEPAVFTARAKALLRRARPASKNQEQIKFGQIVLDLKAHEVKAAGEVIHMTPSEFKILVEMGKNVGKVLTRDHLVQAVQGDGITVTGRTIDTHVFGMRKKLGASGEIIETIRGVGYRVRSE
ncbi:MAG: DNA-binding response regulator [Oligoflexia bacterium]|nr:MAG: DNA-binding response regulator [Oligoflexia bacterium]